MLSDSLAELLIQSIPGLLIPGLTVTIPLTLVSFGLGLILALFTALVQIARGPCFTADCPLLRLDHPGYAASGPAVHHFLRASQPQHQDRCHPFRHHRLYPQRRRLYLRNPPGGNPFRSPGTAGSRLLCGDDLFPDHAADHHPPSFLDGFSTSFQFLHRPDQRYIPGGQCDGAGNVHVRSADRCPHLRAFCPVL